MLKVGVIGAGSISDLHIKPYKEHKNVDLMALSDVNEQRVNEKCAIHGIPNAYTDYKDLLDNEEVDAVSICTWNNTHAEIAIDALEAGKHVLVEKPLSMTMAEAEAVADAVERTGKVLQVGYVRRHGANVKLLKEFIDRGDFGEIYYAKASCLRRLGNPGGWFSDASKSGGGPLIDLGVHMVDICWYLMGKPRPVSVSGNAYYRLGNRAHVDNLSFYKAADYDSTVNDVEDMANAVIRFENGASLFVDVSFTIHTKKDEMSVKIFGDKGGAEIEPELVITTEKHNTIFNMVPQVDSLGFDFNQAFAAEINHFVSCCLEGTENIAPVKDGVEVMRMLNAVYESSRSRKEIYL